MLRADVKTVRKHALAINRALQYVKIANERENRLLVEIHLLRQAAHRDGIDRDANRARIYEYLRRYRTDDERLGGGCGGGGGGARRGGGGGALGGGDAERSARRQPVARAHVGGDGRSRDEQRGGRAASRRSRQRVRRTRGLLATSAAAAARPTSCEYLVCTFLQADSAFARFCLCTLVHSSAL